MYDHILDNLKNSANDGDRLQASLDRHGRRVEVIIDADGGRLDAPLALARKFLSALDAYDRKARANLSEHCLSTFNDSWRDEDEPELAESEFRRQLTLEQVSFMSDSCVEFCYDDNDLFGGHCLVSQAFDGERFEHVQMYG